MRIEPAEIAAPLASSHWTADGRLDVVLQPVRLEGVLSLRDADGFALGAVDLDRLPESLRHAVVMSVAAPPGSAADTLYLVQHLSDGRRSREIAILLEPPKPTTRPRKAID